ncbi:MAG: DUF169 domain-containing protein [Bacteroidales bacterium]|jgi:uncharacterized protein (DUF169 family)
MNIEIKDHFIQQWKKYFNNADLPVIFYYTDNPGDATVVSSKGKWNCLICELQKVRAGQSLAFSSESLKCGGAKRYLGFADRMRPNFEYFLSCGIENEMEGERYIRTPQLVKELMKNQKKLAIIGKYIVFKRWDNLVENDNPDVAIFFATPDVLSGLFTLANFDQSEPNSTITPFGAGCGSIVYYPFIEKDSQRPRAVIGMFDVSARPCVQEGVLTFSVPMAKFMKMISYMDESFLITDSWKKIQKRIK